MESTISTFPAAPVGTLYGVQNIALVNAPGAGNEWKYTFPAGYFYRLIAAYTTFTTSATVANRNPGVAVTDGTNVLGRFGFQTNMTASNTCDVNYCPAGYFQGFGVTTTSITLGVANAWFPPGYTIGSYTPNLQATDAYTSVRILLDQLDYGPYGVRELEHAPTFRDVAETHEVAGMHATHPAQTATRTRRK